MARRVLPQEVAAPAGAGVRFAAGQFHRDQRHASIRCSGPRIMRAWYEATPDDFVFSVKGSRFITHMKKLKDVETPLANFFASGVLRLGEKLGPFLWQLPPNLGYRPRAAGGVLPAPPARHAAPRRSSRDEHDERLDGRSWTETDGHPSAAPLPGGPPSDVCERGVHRAACASTTSRWSSPTPRANGRSSKMPRATLSMCGCTATRSFTPAGTSEAALRSGRKRCAPGRRAVCRRTRNSPARALARRAGGRDVYRLFRQ